MSRTDAEIAPKCAETVALGAHFFAIAARELRTALGEIVPLRSQSAEVLAALAARAGGIVTKSELIESVWADIAVTDDSLVQCIADIRRALGDDAHKIVQTFPKKGYRLNPPRSRQPEAASPPCYPYPPAPPRCPCSDRGTGRDHSRALSHAPGQFPA